MILNIPNHEYHAAERMNNSGIKQILKSPAHYQIYLRQKSEPTKAMIIGSAVHAATLEPDVFEKDYAAIPEGLDRRTKAGKETFAELEASGKTILAADDYQNVLDIALAVRSHETAGKLFNHGIAEVSVFSEIDDVPVKARFDWLRNNIIVDLKTTDDASPDEFVRSIAKYGYDVQAAWYLDVAKADGIEISNFIFVAVEKNPPYAVGLYELDAESIEIGRTKYQKGLSIYRHCVKTGEWPSYSPDIITLQLPKWAMREAA